jgi:hypothetical protein
MKVIIIIAIDSVIDANVFIDGYGNPDKPP